MSTTAAPLFATHRLFFRRPNTPLFPSLHSSLPISSRTRSWPSESHRRETGFAANVDPIGRSSFQTVGSSRAAEMGARCPVLLFDVMDTIVRDPFYEDVPAFFGISMKELLMIKHPTAWIEFEKGLISEEELNANFFKDKRGFDSSGLKACMANGYAYLEGVEALLGRLKSRGYQMHAFTNYPPWYELIEEKLELSKYLSWTFVSCHTGNIKGQALWIGVSHSSCYCGQLTNGSAMLSGKRKPDPDAFVEAAKQLGLSPSDVIFIDDQSRNVEAAIQIGMTGLTFQGAKKLERDLLELGVLF